jgi:hypothetical protein
MYCANDECKQLVIRVHEDFLVRGVSVEFDEMRTQTWFARPRFALRSIDPLVPEPFRTDYREAAAILDPSPRMSAVLSRRLLADLLKTYAGLDDFGLNARIEKFRRDSKHPSGLREGMQHFREIGDFGAHTQKADLEAPEESEPTSEGAQIIHVAARTPSGCSTSSIASSTTSLSRPRRTERC